MPLPTEPTCHICGKGFTAMQSRIEQYEHQGAAPTYAHAKCAYAVHRPTEPAPGALVQCYICGRSIDIAHDIHTRGPIDGIERFMHVRCELPNDASERQTRALESIAESLQKIANPLMLARQNADGSVSVVNMTDGPITVTPADLTFPRRAMKP